MSTTTSGNKYPEFFKVFLPEQHSEKMLIPVAFVRMTYLQAMIPEDVILRNRRGRVWHLKTLLIGHKLYFHDGWKLFREENSLKEADFLFFTYNGINEFKFKILEQSTWCEKEEKEDHVIELEEEEKAEEEVEEEEEEQDGDEGSKDDYVEDEDHDDQEYRRMEENNEEVCGIGEVTVTSKSSGENARSLRIQSIQDCQIDAEIYVQPNNPYFIAKLIKKRPNELHIPRNVIKDFSLGFPNRIPIVCCQCRDIQRNEIQDYHLRLPQKTIISEKYGEVEGEVCTWKDGRVCVQGWASFCRKNRIKDNCVCICEMVLGEGQIVEMFWVHCARK